MKFTDEEIEKGLRNLTAIDLTDKTNYDSCGRLIPPRGMMIIQAALDYIQRLKAERDEAIEVANAEVKITDNIRKQALKDFSERVIGALENYAYDERTTRDIVECIFTELYGADE